MIIGKKDIVLFYEYFYSRKYGNVEYRFKPSGKADQELDKFIIFLDKRYNLACIGRSFLTRYFAFQFKRVEHLTFKRFSSKDKGGKIQIYDILGRKAIEYWEKRNLKFDFEIDQPINIALLSLNEKSSTLDKAEESEKNRFVNTERGFLNCIERTSLFDHKSIACATCIFQTDCKKLLKENYNKIYIARGYGSSTT